VTVFKVNRRRRRRHWDSRFRTCRYGLGLVGGKPTIEYLGGIAVTAVTAVQGTDSNHSQG
jgi:hypothetical protein